MGEEKAGIKPKLRTIDHLQGIFVLLNIIIICALSLP